MSGLPQTPMTPRIVCLATGLALFVTLGHATAPAGRYAEPSIVNGIGVIADTRTGLTWQRAPAPGFYDWFGAQTYCAGLGEGWRLPSLEEIQTIVDDTTRNPAADTTAFPSLPSDYTYWTLSRVAGDDTRAWDFSASLGDTSTLGVAFVRHVLCVR